MSVRCDKADLNLFCETSRFNLNSFIFDYTILHCSSSCNHAKDHQTINVYYRHIVKALQSAEHLSVLRISQSAALKPFWNDELDDLKHKSVFGMTFENLMVPQILV